MRQTVIALVSGVIFGIGLALSGMADPMRVRGFLDIFGEWDMTLAFVMAGAVLVMAIAWQVQRRMPAPFAGDAFSVPTVTKIDSRLVLGSAIFGIGWGFAGLCPGPAIADIALAPSKAVLFVASMMAGMLIHRLLVK